MRHNIEDMMVVTSVEEIRNICAANRKRDVIFLGLVITGLGVLLAKQIKDLERLERKHRNLEEDYHNYVVNHSEYTPDTDYEEDWPDIDEI